MSVTTPPGPPVDAGGAAPGVPGGAPPGSEHGRPSRRGWIVALSAVAAAALVGGVLFAVLGGGGPGTAPPTTTVPPGTTAPSSPTTTPGALTGTERAVYPLPGSGVRFAHPVAAARSFAVDFVGFVDPIVDRFVSSGAGTGTVAVRASSTGPPTSVHLERITGSWWVLGASTDHIRLDAPTAGTSILSPVVLRGASTAFEATVSVEVRQDGRRSPIGTGVVMGGSNGEMGPFDGRVAFGAPSASRGALMLSTVSMENGNLWEATVVRVQFAPVVVLSPSTPCPDYSMARPSPPAGEMVVTVYYSCSVDAAPVATYRLRPTSASVLRTALEELLAGPTPAEAAAGLTSWFSAQTATLLAGVTVSAGAATVDFHDLRPVIPNASSSAGSHLLLAQLDATVFQFPSVQSVTYRIDGDCQTFSEWLQLSGCVTGARPAGS